MKKGKKNIKGLLLEGLAELAIFLFSFAIGVGIITLFGVELDYANIDFDLLCLIGIVSFFGIFAIVNALVLWLRKTFKRKDK